MKTLWEVQAYRAKRQPNIPEEEDEEGSEDSW